MKFLKETIVANESERMIRTHRKSVRTQRMLTNKVQQMFELPNLDRFWFRVSKFETFALSG